MHPSATETALRCAHYARWVENVAPSDDRGARQTGEQLTRATARMGPTDTDNHREISEAVRRVVAARISDPHTTDDLVQETLARLMEARRPLVGPARIAYAIVVARNLVTDVARNDSRVLKNRHRVIDLRDPERPEEAILRAEERRALETALKQIPHSDRRAVIAHEVLDVDTTRLAQETGSTPGGVATKLARARARLRVEYLLALRGIEPPTAKCRPVLISLSSGDTRRQATLGTGQHLLECPTCASLGPALLERRRALAGLLPLAALARYVSAIKGWIGTTAGKAVGATAVVGAGAAVVALNLGGPQAKPEPPPPPIVTVSGKEPVVPGVAGALDQHAGQRVRARRIRVLRVVEDEGFWVGTGSGTAMWVELNTRGESVIDIDRGNTVSFVGFLRRNPSGFVGDQGLDKNDSGRLRRQGHHIVVRPRDVQKVGP
jgi:RNA polymerase sigma factor (sigma-70 family)